MYVRPVGNNTYKECKWLVEEDAVVLMLLAAYHPGHSRQYYENETSTFHKTVAHNIWARPEFGFRGRRGPMAISVRIQSWLKSTRYAPGGKKGGGQPKDNRARRYLEMRGALGIDNASHTIHECEWDQSLVAFDAPRFKELIEFTMERSEANRTDSVGTEVGGGAEGVARATVGGPRQGASPSGQTSGGVGTGEAIGAGGFEAAGGVPRGGTQGNSAQGQMGDRASAPSMGPDLVYGSSSLDSNGLGGGEVGGGDEGVAPATVTARAPWIQMGLEEGRWEAEMRVWHQQRLVVLIKVHLEMGYPVAVTVLVEIYKEQQLVVLVKVHLKVGYPVAVLVLVEIYKEVSLEVVGGSGEGLQGGGAGAAWWIPAVQPPVHRWQTDISTASSGFGGREVRRLGDDVLLRRPPGQFGGPSQRSFRPPPIGQFMRPPQLGDDSDGDDGSGHEDMEEEEEEWAEGEGGGGGGRGRGAFGGSCGGPCPGGMGEAAEVMRWVKWG
ncbi:hypothetical protein CYMTET_24927 [Cymbomonas tetramitiformis]|uniref:Uncharacterized protein n=1 Tax=Cymbomonas tetramitiformis TaxID=36881 RepID=A0AAE0KZP8_9CHLO|nr:hypothetical protein CYMTET_24927 [Cymbomonas tetramitiformis]